MSRYIDADALLEKYNVKDTNIAECLTDKKMARAFERFCIIADAVEEQPTVDAVPVVRCGRCEYYSNEMNCCSYVNGLQNVTKTDYCSYGRCADGERKEKEND